MNDVITSHVSRPVADGWNSDHRQVSISLVAPKDCGKTAYLAALRHMATRASCVVRDRAYRLSEFVGCGPTSALERQATTHIEDVYHNITAGNFAEPTPGWYTYRLLAEHLRAGPGARREIYLLDAMGGYLFPGLGSDTYGQQTEEPPPSLSSRLDELGLDDDAEHVLVVFTNEPPPLDDWRMHHQVPSAVADYIKGVRFRRVVLYVACADVLFPRLRDLRKMLERYNEDAESTASLIRYFDHFRGSPHCDFTLDLVRYLDDAGHVGSGEVGVFWGSSFGIERSSGRPNIDPASVPCRLRDPVDWIPSQVVEPVLWGCGLLSEESV